MQLNGNPYFPASTRQPPGDKNGGLPFLPQGTKILITNAGEWKSLTFVQFKENFTEGSFSAIVKVLVKANATRKYEK